MTAPNSSPNPNAQGGPLTDVPKLECSALRVGKDAGTHTPGPWAASTPWAGFSDIRQVVTNRLVFALAHPNQACGDPKVSDEEKYANLAILGASLELFDAAVNKLAACEACKHPELAPGENCSTECSALAAAVAKAEGLA